MRKATLVLATSVAFLLFAVPNSYAGIKKKVQLPAAQSVANGSGVPVKSGSSLSIPGDLQQEYIPADNFSRSTPFKVLPTIDFSIPRTIEHSKGFLKNNAASIVVGGVIAGMIAGLDWVMSPENTSIQKKQKVPVLPVDQNSYYWKTAGYNHQGATPKAAAEASRAANGWLSVVSCDPHTATRWVCTIATNTGSFNIEVHRQGINCPPNSTYDLYLGVCTSEQYAPILESDYDLIDAYVNAQNSDWLRGLLRESCNGSLAPDRCFEDLKDNTTLSGPSTVSGPSTLTTTTGPNGVTSKENKTDFKITYGSDYFIYAPTTTTTTINPDGTTEVETEEPAEEEPSEEEIDATIGDPYAPVVDKYNDIAGGLGDLEGNMSFINYGPWYSFGGACSPITLNLPVMGVYTIDHCPYVIDWIRPTLGFLFAVWTWLHCFALWRETLQNARPI